MMTMLMIMMMTMVVVMMMMMMMTMTTTTTTTMMMMMMVMMHGDGNWSQVFTTTMPTFALGPVQIEQEPNRTLGAVVGDPSSCLLRCRNVGTGGALRAGTSLAAVFVVLTVDTWKGGMGEGGEGGEGVGQREESGQLRLIKVW